jgi:hypothetical protein
MSGGPTPVRATSSRSATIPPRRSAAAPNAGASAKLSIGWEIAARAHPMPTANTSASIPSAVATVRSGEDDSRVS